MTKSPSQSRNGNQTRNDLKIAYVTKNDRKMCIIPNVATMTDRVEIRM